jgi:polyisoprenoid-binding protein YceI
MKTKYLPLIVAAPVLLFSCENPADRTTAAIVTDAVVQSETSSEEGTKYVFTETSQIEFTGSKVTGSHDGGFKSFTGYFTIRDGVPVGTDHRVVINMDSVYSDDERLTGHLKNEDFFHVEKFPESTFDVTTIELKDGENYSVSGNFNLHGVTKNITFPATVVQSDDAVKIHAEFDINRKDFGIVYAGRADDLIRDEVIIRLKLEARPEA